MKNSRNESFHFTTAAIIHVEFRPRKTSCFPGNGDSPSSECQPQMCHGGGAYWSQEGGLFLFEKLKSYSPFANAEDNHAFVSLSTIFKANSALSSLLVFEDENNQI